MRRFSVAACVALALSSGWGCQTLPPASRAESAGQALVERSPTAPQAPPLDVAAERLAKESGATPMAVDLPVDEAAAATHPALVSSGLSATDIDRLAALPLPILLPDDPALLERALVTTGGRWYSASMHLDDLTLLITGRARGFSLPGTELHGAMPDGGLVLTRTDGIITLSFRAYGVAYSLFVECARPSSDVRCTEDDYALGLAQRLGRVAEVAP